MRRATWKVSDLLLLVLWAGLMLGAFRSFWQPPPNPNAALHLVTYLALLSLASLGAFRGRPEARRPCRGFAAFGWLNLICVIRGGFGMATFYDAEAIVEGCRMGMAFGAICAIGAAWCLDRPGVEGPRPDDPGRVG